jgi:hypothetical protein
MKIMYNTEINFSRIREANYLIAKNNGGLKCIFQIKLKNTIYFTRMFHFNPLSSNSTLS